jgi:uncharacterized damage-inducible protein DinB
VVSEGPAFARVLERIARDVLAALEGLSDESLNRPVPLPDTMTLAALATHLVGAGEWWVLATAGNRHVERDRPAEFHATGAVAALAARYEQWIIDIHQVLDNLPAREMERVVEPGEYRGTLGNQTMAVRDCLLHAVEHSANHLGHIQLTRQILLGR